MSSPFWDKINSALGDLFGNDLRALDDVVGPSLADLEGTDVLSDALKTVQAIGPDEQQVINGEGIAPSQVFQANPADQVAAQAQGAVPLNAYDFTPADIGNTRTYSQGSSTNYGTAAPNPFPADNNSLQKIYAALRAVGLNVQAQTLLAKGAYPIGVTYQFNIAGKSLRIERLPQGLQPSGATIGSPTQQPVNSALVINDVRAQQLLGLFLNGFFIQFESTQNPVFIAKPGETFRLPFTKVFVTTFGSSGRWRLITGQGADIEGFTDDRLMRQQLHLWDGGGLFDNPMIHPIPFSINAPLIAGQTVLGNKIVKTSFQFDVAGASFFSNYDSGSGLSQQANGNVVGTVGNKGYKLLWVTSATVTLQDTSGSPNTIFSIGIGKGLADPSQSNFPNSGGIQFPDQVVPANGNVSVPKNFALPYRYILAGFDTWDPSGTGIQATGESLGFTATSITAFKMGVVLDGYYLPAIIPYAPYPMDPMALPTN